MQTPTPSDPIASFWAAARALYQRMRASLGAPEAIAQRRHIERETLAAMRAWLRPIEALVRKLIFIEAAALAREPQAPRLAPVQRATPCFRKATLEPQKRVPSLRIWPRDPPMPARIRQLGLPLLVRDIYRERARDARSRQLNMVRFMRPSEPLRIARRIEALARLLEKPTSAIRRLAKKLRAAPLIALKIALAPWPRSPHADPHLQGDVGGHTYFSAYNFCPNTS
ncbi:MAG: hypothetical protein H7124_09770 [Phycisphaerales bacterium]|nr:hypothetical protein [Hyphomonadaceae bacterium]